MRSVLCWENNQAAGKIWVWTYDDAGNITICKEYAYTTCNLGSVLSTVNYTYGDFAWGDLLTYWNGENFSYDTIGNLTSDGSYTYTWEHGRELASMSNGSTTWSFTYDANGMRTARSNGSRTYSYIYNGSSLSQLTVDGHTMRFTYDASGSPLSINYDGTEYYYVLNLQGDVVAILDGSGSTVVAYTYDAWGDIPSTTGSLSSTLGYYNPLRYRGYVYDNETNHYYLQSRYYYPYLCRFLNADALISTGQGILGNNTFAYCGNNPVIRVDDNGQYYTSGQIHDFVIKDICDDDPNKKGSRKENKIIYPKPVFFSEYGYCDVYDSLTGEVWELKRFSNAPSCQFAVAYVQLSNYVGGRLENNPNKPLKFGGNPTIIPSKVFTKPDSDGRGEYVIGYWDTGVGVLFYDYMYVPSGDEVAVGAAIAILAVLAGWAVGVGAGAGAGVLIPAF